MNDNEDTTVSYGFAYRDFEGKHHKHEVIMDEVTWPEMLNDFVRFMESIYGYEILPSIRIEYPRYCINSEAWQGKCFINDTEEA